VLIARLACVESAGGEHQAPAILAGLDLADEEPPRLLHCVHDVANRPADVTGSYEVPVQGARLDDGHVQSAPGRTERLCEHLAAVRAILGAGDTSAEKTTVRLVGHTQVGQQEVSHSIW
jgi:hypothetical protein